MKKIKKLLISLLCVLSVGFGSFAFSGCEQQGEKGEKGETGAGIQSVEVDENGKLIITLTDGTVLPAIELPTISSTESASDLQYQKIAGKDEYCVMGIGLVAGNDIVIPSTYNGKPVTEIGESAFANTYITSIKIPNTVKTIGEKAFDGCSSLTNVEMPNSMESMGYFVFRGCSSLISIKIPDGVTSIGESAFDGCSSLTSIEIPDSVIDIVGGAFCYCSSLTSIELPEGITNVGWLFRGCSSLTSIEIPDSVTDIGEFAFDGCSDLTSVVIPEGVTSITYGAFNGCSSLTSVYYKGTVADWGNIEWLYGGWVDKELISATRYCYIENEGDVPTDGGNYWHYVDGVPTPWGV